MVRKIIKTLLCFIMMYALAIYFIRANNLLELFKSILICGLGIWTGNEVYEVWKGDK